MGKLRYEEKLGMLCVTRDPYITWRDVLEYNASRWTDLSCKY